MELTNKEMVTSILWRYGCSTSKQIANLIHREFDETLTPAQCAGSLRPLIAAGKAANSKDASGKTVYWLNKDRSLWKDDELNSLKNRGWM